MPLRSLIVASVIIWLAGCAASRGAYHTVGKGETLWRIAKIYGVDMDDVADANDINYPAELKAGRRLFIPNAKNKGKARTPVIQASVERDKNKRIVIDRDFFIWPLKGTVASPFGARGGVRHDGIDIRADEGAPVKAAADGKVVYSSDDLRGYGNLIIVKHKDDIYTVYSHNKKNLVDAGDDVDAGDVIATVGNTGNATGYHLHFEIRKGKKVLNPLFYLP